MKREINLMDVSIEGIDRNTYTKEQMEDVCKQAGHFVFQKADSHEMLEIGRDLTDFKPIKIHEDTSEKLKAIFKDNFLFFVHEPINKYIKGVFEGPLAKT